MNFSRGLNGNCIDCNVKSECFKKLTKEELQLANCNKVEVKFLKKEIVAKQGTFATNLMFVKEGSVKLYIEGNSGASDLIINIFPEGEILGISSILGDSTYHYSISALENSTLCLIDITTIRELMKRNNEFALSLFQKLSKSTSHAYDHLYNLANKQSKARIASVFVYLSKDVYKSTKFKIPLSRKDLAEFSGMSTLNAIRVLKELRKDELIHEKNGNLEIPDFEALERVSITG